MQAQVCASIGQSYLASSKMKKSRKKILTLFGTRPEAIKLAPVMRGLEDYGDALRTINVTSAQHTDLLYPFVSLFNVRIDHDLRVMSHDQSPNQVCARVLDALDRVLEAEKPEMILVQGDTTTALAGALAGFHRRLAVGHVEAGLRSDDASNPFPEEMNRRLITRLATYHFAATARNRETLLSEGVEPQNIFVTGNPVVDSLKAMLRKTCRTPLVVELLERTKGLRRVVLTTHRRESFGALMTENLRVLRAFVETHEDVALVFPVHPNPRVGGVSRATLSNHPRIHLVEPLNYQDFIQLLSHSWLIVSDSGGVQEEAPSLGKPLLVLRENTERPEALEARVARLVGGRPARLRAMLEEAHQSGSWVDEVKRTRNPFGAGDSGKRIAKIVARLLDVAPRIAPQPSRKRPRPPFLESFGVQKERQRADYEIVSP